MRQSIVQHNLDQVLGASETVEGCDTPVHQPSYHPTPWLMVNRILDVVDKLTGGRAGWVQRFFSFAFIGGCAACVNLTVFFIVNTFLHLPVSNLVHIAIAFVVASEISLLANFIPNDYFTFRRMAGNRSWGMRCARFHLTAFSGVALTYLFQFCFNFFLHIPAFFAQAMAIFIVLFYNFTFHHVFTYRHKKSALVSSFSLEDEAELIKQAVMEKIERDVDALNLAPVEVTSSQS
jgi:putative flippase GtrA